MIKILLVLNPQGIILVKCNSLNDANDFIDDHLGRNTSNYQYLTGYTPTRNDYHIVDIDFIETYPIRTY